MDVTVEIRPALPADAAALAALGMQVWLHTYATQGVSGLDADHVWSSFTPARMRALMDDPTRALTVACRGDFLLAYALLGGPMPGASFAGADRLLELETLYVQAHFKGQGLGRALLNWARDEAARRSGHRGLCLKVNARNASALAFYRAQGLDAVGETFFELGEQRHLNLILSDPPPVA